MSRINLHNHSNFSDGKFSVNEIFSAAREAKLEGVGISDHFFTSKVFGKMTYQKYLQEKWLPYLAERKKFANKNADKTALWFGIEIDSAIDRLGTSFSDLPWGEINSLNYVLLEYVGEPGGLPLNDLSQLREHCSVPIFLAHPNIGFFAENKTLERLPKVLTELEIGIEVPAGMRNPWFWFRYPPSLLSELSLVIGTDTHDNLKEVAAIDKTLSFLEKNHLLKNLWHP